MPVRMTHTSPGEAGLQCPAASMAVTWLSNKPLKLNVPQTEPLTSLWILTPPPLPHRPPPLAQLMAAPSVQAKSLRVTWNLFLSHPHPTHQPACGLQLHTVPESAHCLPPPWPPAWPGPPSSASRTSVVAGPLALTPRTVACIHCCTGLGTRHSLCPAQSFLRSPQGLCLTSFRSLHTHHLLNEVQLAPI